MAKISDHLRACIEIEQRCAELYFSLSRYFPERRQFFRELARAEEKHANILSLACGLEGLCTLPSDTGKAPMDLKRTRTIISDLMRRIDASEISSLQDVLPDLMRLEAATAEGYMDEIMKGGADEGLLKYLRQFHDEGISHFEQLKALANENRTAN